MKPSPSEYWAGVVLAVLIGVVSALGIVRELAGI